MTADVARADREWLALREPADAAARSVELVRLLRPLLGRAPLTVHDLGSGTGSMRRWLSPRLGGRQHWVEHDRDADLLAVAGLPGDADVTVETRRTDLARLTVAEVADADLITASALLDMLTHHELVDVVRVCAASRVPCLVTLSVVGRVSVDPPDPLDDAVQAAFNAHQRRDTSHGRLLGPDAFDACAGMLGAAGMSVVEAPSPWRLVGRPRLVEAWLGGWLEAACEQEPGLAPAADEYASRRRDQLARGELQVTVHHRDLLAWWP
jgi:hypothetical protein